MPKLLLIIFLVLIIVIFAVITASLVANYLFNQKVKQELEQLLAGSGDSVGQIIEKKDLAGLPLCVQNWLQYSQIIGKERITTVYSKQSAQLRLKENQLDACGNGILLYHKPTGLYLAG
ncbi:hypothetical protein N752_18760 [Desulforamulus aquiferis]|nr:hypothetical protein N752_18760 [Desulforamulus aquiferis]